jgi:selenocysteine-specific elongation factor
MYVIGTSGHIDHGKTSLIRQLSGVDCDRLPEEKEREMTIDLGFASMNYPRFGTVSIIDVPGHERFIRNMVAGAWGVDLALLVIAVDDGWMPQTEDHFRVLQLLGVERIIVVLNKIDVADQEMIDFVEAEVEEKFLETQYAESNIARVSSKTGEGIPELKETIAKNLRQLNRAANVEKPYLFIDRAFVSKGFGSVVTGTLKNGAFEENENVTILPLNREVKIKRIESHFETHQEGHPSQRTALNLSGVSSEELQRGHIICRRNFFTESKDIVASLNITSSKKLKNNLGIELLVGTALIRGKVIVINNNEEENNRYTVRLKLQKPWFFYAGQNFIVTSPGGFRIHGGGSDLLPFFDDSLKKRVKKNLITFTGKGLADSMTFILQVKEIISLDNLYGLYPQSDKNLTKEVESIKDKGDVKELKGFLLTKEFYDRSWKKIIDAIEAHTGINRSETASKAGIEEYIAQLLLPFILKEEHIVEKDGLFFGGNAITKDTLSTERAKILSELEATGLNGLEMKTETNEFRKKDIKALIRLEFAVSLDGNIIYHHEVYENACNSIMKLFDTLDKITVSDAKEAVDLSRKYMIPLLNRIETDGLVKRIGDFRIKN